MGGQPKKNLREWGGKNVWWQQTNFGVCKKFVGVVVAKKLCGQKRRAGGGKILFGGTAGSSKLLGG